MFFNGFSAPVIGLAPPLISAAWFPVDQRGTATALMTTANYLGQAVGFFATSLAVPSLPQLPNGANSTNPYTPADVDARHSDLETLYEVQAILALFILIGVGAYFPDKPEKPPARSAMQPKTDFCIGMGQLLKLWNFWILVLAFGVPNGIYSGWVAFLGPNLNALGISQSNAAYMGTGSIFAGCLAGVVVGAISDKMRGKTKLIILCMYCGAAASFLWFALMCARYR